MFGSANNNTGYSVSWSESFACDTDEATQEEMINARIAAGSSNKAVGNNSH